MRSTVIIIITMALSCLAAGSALATPPGAGAIIEAFSPSVRAAGMGDAGVATHWGGDVPVWSNPGLLGYRTGLRYADMESEVASGLADDLVFTDQSVTIGYAGFGLLFCRDPLDGSYLDFGTQQAIDEDGNVIGEFSSWEQAQRFGVGLRVLYLAESILGRSAHDLSRWGDLGLGYMWTNFEDCLAPDDVLQDLTGGSASGEARSYGIHARVTPVNSIGGDGPLSSFGGMVLDVAYGWALLDDADEMIVHVDDDGDPFPRRFVTGWSARLAVGGPQRHKASLLAPLLNVGYTTQSEEPGILWNGRAYDYERDDSGEYDEDRWGVEVSILNVFHWRRGHMTAEYGDIDGDTSGWGVGLEAEGIGGFRYDEATVPQARGLDDVDRSGWSVWIDVAGLLHAAGH